MNVFNNNIEFSMTYEKWESYLKHTYNLFFEEYQQYQDAGTDDDGEFLEEDEEEIPEDC